MLLIFILKGTNDLEWFVRHPDNAAIALLISLFRYDPEAVTTKGGKLVLNFKAEPNHDLQYKGNVVASAVRVARDAHCGTK